MTSDQARSSAKKGLRVTMSLCCVTHDDDDGDDQEDEDEDKDEEKDEDGEKGWD